VSLIARIILIVLQYKKGDEDWLILLAHFFLDPKPGKFFSERVYGHGEFDTAEFDILAVGHEHVNKGVFNHNGKYFIDSGAITRVSASDSDRNMVPQAILFSVSKEGFKSTAIPIKHRPASEVFGDIVEPDFIEEVPDWDEFDSKLENLMGNVSYNKIEDNLKLLDYPDKVKTTALDYIKANLGR
jgi:hypothetical protein